MDANNKFRRRSFLGTGLFSLGALMINPVGATAKSVEGIVLDGILSKTLFVAESGMLGGDKLFILGLLQVNGPLGKTENFIQQLRIKHQYRSRFTYGSNDNFKIPYAKALIDFLTSQKALSYQAVVFDGGRAGNVKQRPSKKALMEKRLDCYDRLLKDGNGKLFKDKVFVKNQTAYGPSEYFKDSFKSTTNSKLEAIDSRQNDLLQLSDFLTGCIRADMSKQVTNLNKLALIQYLKDKTQLADLKPNNKKNNFAVLSA